MLPPEGKTLLRATINHQLQELEKETKESQKTGSLSIEEANQLSIRTAILIVEAALGTQCKRVEKKQEESRYISRLNERLQTIKETCDLIRQIQDTNTGNAENVEQLTELDILIDRLCLCEIPNLPVPLDRNSIQTWAGQYAGEQIKHLENCLKSARDQEKYKEQIRKRDLFTNPQTRGKWLDLHFKTSPPAMPSYAVDGTGKIHRAPEDVKNIYLTEGLSS
jgi:hypothetical protein